MKIRSPPTNLRGRTIASRSLPRGSANPAPGAAFGALGLLALASAASLVSAAAENPLVVIRSAAVEHALLVLPSEAEIEGSARLGDLRLAVEVIDAKSGTSGTLDAWSLTLYTGTHSGD